jgi:hypothetical protein
MVWTGLIWLRTGTSGELFLSMIIYLWVSQNAGKLPSGYTRGGLLSGAQLCRVS